MPRPAPPPPRVNGVRVAVIGTALWALALVVALVLHQRLTDSGRGWWITTAAIGVGLGLFGAWFVRRYQRRNG